MLCYMHDDFINNLLNSGALQELQEKKRKGKGKKRKAEKSRRRKAVGAQF